MGSVEQSELNNSNLQQAEELEALSAIFYNEWTKEGGHTYSIKICSTDGNEVYLQVTLQESYPLYSAPSYQISAPWMNRKAKNKLKSELDYICRQNAGKCIIHLWIQKIKDSIEDKNFDFETENANKSLEDMDLVEVQQRLQSESFKKDKEDVLPTIIHGEPIVDRKSVFQAHIAKVVSVKQVKQVLEILKENRKIASAKHNIYAYRFVSEKNIIQDCDDDGEARAGPVLLHLLEISDARDTMIVVTRWFGGIQLGSDRYKHISNAASGLLFKKIPASQKSTVSKSKKRTVYMRLVKN